jgi:multisubunit Na+/H+ antiporter MnhF subunit
MFKTLPDGVEIYFAWPSRTARIIPNKAVKQRIALRDSALRAWVAFAGLITVLEKSHLQNSPIALLILIIGVVGIVERRRYLAKLKTLSLELVETKKREAHPKRGEGNPEMPQSIQITSEEVDKAYIHDYDRFDGVVGIATGVLFALGSLWLLSTEVPLIFSLFLTFGGLAIAYVGFRILAGKRSRPRVHRARHKDAI